jgi:nucleoside-diphosphate-sugar epimerase
MPSFATMVKSVTIIGCGWLGKALGKAFIEKGISVKGTTTTPQKLEELREMGISPFLFQSDLLNNIVLTELGSDVVVVTVPPSKRGQENDSLAMHQRLIEQLKSLGNPPLCYTSSTSAYPDEDRVFTEQDILPEGLMLNIENLYQSAFPECTILRLGGLFGPERNPARFFSGKKIVPRPFAAINMTHQIDAAQALLAIMISGKSGIYNVVSPEHPTRVDFYTRAALASGMEVPDFDLTDLPKGKIVSSSKLIREIGYTFQCGNPLSCL